MYGLLNFVIVIVIVLVGLYYLHVKYDIADKQPIKWILAKLKDIIEKKE